MGYKPITNTLQYKKIDKSINEYPTKTWFKAIGKGRRFFLIGLIPQKKTSLIKIKEATKGKKYSEHWGEKVTTYSYELKATAKLKKQNAEDIASKTSLNKHEATNLIYKLKKRE